MATPKIAFKILWISIVQKPIFTALACHVESHAWELAPNDAKVKEWKAKSFWYMYLVESTRINGKLPHDK